MAAQHGAGHIWCPSSGVSIGQRAPGLLLPLPRCSLLEPEPAARRQLPPLGTWGLPNADFSTVYRIWAGSEGGGEIPPRNIKMFSRVLTLLNH